MTSPRVQEYDELLDLSGFVWGGKLRVRLHWSQGVQIDYLPYLRYEKLNATRVKLALTEAVHSRLGAVRGALNSSEDDYVTLRPGEQIELTYYAEPPPRGDQRVAVLIDQEMVAARHIYTWNGRPGDCEPVASERERVYYKSR